MIDKDLAGNYDRAVEDALRSAPLTAPPPLLYAAVMRRVRETPVLPRFRVLWLDLALSLFFAGMLAVVWFALRSIPAVWISYLRNQALWSFQRAIYLDMDGLVWLAVGTVLALLAAAAGALLATNSLKGLRKL